jgi:hypothetical protein
VSPTDNLVPAAIGELGAAVDVESEWYAECPSDDLAPVDACECIVEVPIEHRWRKVEVRRRIMSHEFRPDRFQIRKDQWPKIGAFPQCKDFQSHDACPTLSFSINPPILHAVLKFETLHVIASAAKQSTPLHGEDGLLRGACHRAALRADPLARNDG